MDLDNSCLNQVAEHRGRYIKVLGLDADVLANSVLQKITPECLDEVAIWGALRRRVTLLELCSQVYELLQASLQLAEENLVEPNLCIELLSCRHIGICHTSASLARSSQFGLHLGDSCPLLSNLSIELGAKGCPSCLPLLHHLLGLSHLVQLLLQFAHSQVVPHFRILRESLHLCLLQLLNLIPQHRNCHLISCLVQASVSKRSVDRRQLCLGSLDVTQKGVIHTRGSLVAGLLLGFLVEVGHLSKDLKYLPEYLLRSVIKLFKL